MDDFLYHLHQSIDCEPQLLQVFENCYADTLKKAVKDMGDGRFCRNGRLFQDTLAREGKGALVKPGIFTGNASLIVSDAGDKE